ncbi:MAG TPA: hypothetical protein PKD15_00795 [Candidatus Saccharibacteria bacterium]|nr:hypothetical protein [Candidatus Saccharibacteria bacterium]
MEDAINYYPDGVARVLRLLKETFGEDFTYYDDDIGDVPEKSLPCIMVREGTGSINANASGTDLLREQIVITVSYNTKDDLRADQSQDLTGAKLRRIVKGQYPDGHARAGYYMDKTIMAVLRKHYTLDDAVIENTIETDFDVAQRGANTYTKEAYITLTIGRRALVPARD